MAFFASDDVQCGFSTDIQYCGQYDRGRFAGEDALAAVGASYPITVIFMAFAVGMNLGASVIVSRLFGAVTAKA